MIGTEERLSPRPARAPALDLALGVAMFAGALVSLLHLRIHPQRFPLDLDVYREAGRYALHGRDPFSPGFGDSLRIKLPFTYPPFAALVFVPLTLLPRTALLVAWTALCIGLFGVIVHVAVRPALLARGWSHPMVLAAAAGVLVWSVPVAQTISYGQINLVLVAACLLVPLGVALGCIGLWRATRAHRAGTEITAVALVGLTALVVSPISWQHHAVWIVPAAAALIAWATTPKRAGIGILAVAVFLF